jgi:hypothetical protein
MGSGLPLKAMRCNYLLNVRKCDSHFDAPLSQQIARSNKFATDHLTLPSLKECFATEIEKESN